MTTPADPSSVQRLVGPDAFRGLLQAVPDAMAITLILARKLRGVLDYRG